MICLYSIISCWLWTMQGFSHCSKDFHLVWRYDQGVLLVGLLYKGAEIGRCILSMPPPSLYVIDERPLLLHIWRIVRQWHLLRYPIQRWNWGSETSINDMLMTSSSLLILRLGNVHEQHVSNGSRQQYQLYNPAVQIHFWMRTVTAHIGYGPRLSTSDKHIQMWVVQSLPWTGSTFTP